MPNPPRKKGTAGESAFVLYGRAHGFPTMERPALRGRADEGDVTGVPGAVFEVKCQNRYEIGAWLSELDREVANAHADVGTLVIKPVGVSLARVGDWWHVRRCAADLRLLRAAGHGMPLDGVQ